jgi:phosphoglycolate phosphatase
MTLATMTRSQTRLAIFDLDGTLIDSVGDILAAVNRMLGEEGRAPLTLAEIRPMVGDGAAKLVERALAARGGAPGDRAAPLRHFLRYYDESPVVLTRLYPGVPETLDVLRGRGIRLALCTNKPERTSRAILHHFGLADHFDRLIGGDSLPWRKPDGRVPAAITAALGIEPAGAVLIGDSEVDAATAAAAGIRFILMTYGYHRGPAEAIAGDARLDRFSALAAELC